jgi:hypothetical protein
LRAPTPDLNWLPATVRGYMLQVEELFRPVLSGKRVTILNEHLAIMHRLASDARMKHVWRQLQPRAKSDKALIEFFDCAWQRARFPHFVETPQDRARLAAPYSKAVELCRWTKEHDIAAQMNPDLTGALDIVARHFDEVARRKSSLDSPLIVKHHGEEDVARAYVRVLGHLTRRLFGSTLVRTVATTASVALGRDIDWRLVRNWTKP